MKQYHFNPNDHGEEYFVMAEDKIKAHEYLLKYFKNRINKSSNLYYKKMWNRYLEDWKIVNPLDNSTFFLKYTLDEYNVGQVIQSEIS